jgi:hypothetical protein
LDLRYPVRLLLIWNTRKWNAEHDSTQWDMIDLEFFQTQTKPMTDASTRFFDSMIVLDDIRRRVALNGKRAHDRDEQMSIEPRARLMHRPYQTQR